MPLLTRVCVLLAVALVVYFYYWTAKTTGADMRIGGQHVDYYNLLVDGFQRRQLHMNAEVHPDLLALPENQRPGNAPYLLDASLYKDRYYLYFGVPPAVLLYWPFATLTGHDLPEVCAAVVVMTLAFAFATWWWLDVRKRFFPQLGPLWTGLVILAIGLGTGAPSALRRPMFYEVAIGAGFACMVLALWAISRAVLRQTDIWKWMALAGLAVGLAVGSRANLLLGGLVLLVSGSGAVALNTSGEFRERARSFWRALLACGAVCAAVGLALAAYNYARFGNPLEFGHTYQLGINPQKMFRASNFLHNLRVYYLSTPELNGYFPYVAPAGEPPKPFDYVGREHAHGEWIWLPLVALTAAALAWNWRLLKGSPARWILGLLGLLFLVNALVLLFSAVRANRYMLDFHPALVFSIVLVLGYLFVRRGWAAAVLKALGAVGLAAAIVFNVFASMQVHGFFAATAPLTYERLAGFCDRFVWPLLPSEAKQVGDRVFEVRWPNEIAQGKREPLMSAGSSLFDDVLWIEYGGENNARFRFQHGELGQVVGEWFQLTPGAEARVRVSGAFLLPNPRHPWYGDRTEVERFALKRRLTIAVDGLVCFSRYVASYDSSPNRLWLGNWRYPAGERVSFSGSIRPLETVAPARSELNRLRPEDGALRFSLLLPQVMYGQSEPLVATGQRNAFDSLVLYYVEPGMVQIIHDKASGGARYSEKLPIDYAQPQYVEVEGPMAYDRFAFVAGEAAERKQAPERFRVWWNGVEVFESDTPPHPSSRDSIVVGMNAWGSTVGRSYFTGERLRVVESADVGSVRPGTLDGALPGDETLRFGHGTLLELRRRDGSAAGLFWDVNSEGALRLTWLHETESVSSRRIPKAEAAGKRVSIQLPGVRPQAEHQGLAANWVSVDFGDLNILAAETAFTVEPDTQASSVAGQSWEGSGLADTIHKQAQPTESENVRPKPGLPGRIRLRFVLTPNNRIAGSDPLLSAGKTGAADSVYVRDVGGDNYVFGVDHWGVGARESAPVKLAMKEVHSLYIELGSLFEGGDVPKDRVRLILNGTTILDTTLPLYPVDPDQVALAANPLGMSTSSPKFNGSIVSIHTRMAPPNP